MGTYGRAAITDELGGKSAVVVGSDGHQMCADVVTYAEPWSGHTAHVFAQGLAHSITGHTAEVLPDYGPTEFEYPVELRAGRVRKVSKLKQRVNHERTLVSLRSGGDVVVAGYTSLWALIFPTGTEPATPIHGPARLRIADDQGGRDTVYVSQDGHHFWWHITNCAEHWKTKLNDDDPPPLPGTAPEFARHLCRAPSWGKQHWGGRLDKCGAQPNEYLLTIRQGSAFQLTAFTHSGETPALRWLCGFSPQVAP